MRWAASLAVLVACGRIDFDPIRSDAGGGDAASDGAAGGSADAAVTACSFALVAPINTRVATSTCAGAHDLVDSCGPAGTQEVVFAFTPAATGGYSFRAFDPGTNNVSSSTQQLDPVTCQPTGGCAGLLGVPVTGGTTAYFAVEASGGGCVNIEFEAM